MLEEGRPAGPEYDMLIDLQGGGGPAPPMGFVGFPQPPALPVMPQPPSNTPFSYPPPGGSSGGAGGGGYPSPPFNYNIPAYPALDQEKNDLNTHFQMVSASSPMTFLIVGFGMFLHAPLFIYECSVVL